MPIASFGDVWRDFRKHKRMSQRTLAEQIGVHRNTIWSWEQGNYLPDSKSMVLELAYQLGLSDTETRQLLESSLTAPSPHWSVPYQRNAFFTGREVLLDMLHQKLGADQARFLSNLFGRASLVVPVKWHPCFFRANRESLPGTRFLEHGNNQAPAGSGDFFG